MDGELRKLSTDLRRASVTAQLKSRLVVAKTARDIEADAKGLAPVDTGNLKGSITATVKGMTAEIGPTASYGNFLEFGTSRMAPQPYMGPAVDRREPGFIQAMATLAEEGLGR